MRTLLLPLSIVFGCGPVSSQREEDAAGAPSDARGLRSLTATSGSKPGASDSPLTLIVRDRRQFEVSGPGLDGGVPISVGVHRRRSAVRSAVLPAVLPTTIAAAIAAAFVGVRVIDAGVGAFVGTCGKQEDPRQGEQDGTAWHGQLQE